MTEETRKLEQMLQPVVTCVWLMKKTSRNAFEKAAASQSGGSFFGDFWAFIKTNKKWWLVPIIVLFLAFALLILLSSTGLAPFIYTIF